MILNFPLRNIAFFRTETDSHQNQFPAALFIRGRISLIMNLPNPRLRALVALELDDIEFVGKPDKQINPAPAAHDLTVGISAGRADHQVKDGVKIGLVPSAFQGMGNGGEDGAHGSDERVNILQPEIFREQDKL